MKKVLLICIPIFFIISSCRKIVQDEFNNFDNKITVNSILIENEFAQLHVSLTDELNEFQLKNIRNAGIEMYNQDSMLISFIYTEKGIYESEYIVKENDFFKLKVFTDNDCVTAECVIPKRTDFSDFYVTENAWVDDEGRLQPEVHFTIPNNKLEQQYFEAYLIVYNKNADFIEEEYPILYFDNIEENDETILKSAKIQMMSYSYPPEKYKYQLILKSVNQNYYKYVKSLDDYNLSRYPDFSNSAIVPLNLYTNIENGYGIFCGYSQTISDTIEPIY